MIAELAMYAASVANTYETCLDRQPETAEVVRFWNQHPDPATAICTSPEARANLEPQGLVWFSSSTWLPAVMADVRWCESRGDYRAENPTSTASGGWQFLDSTWRWVTGLPGSASDYPIETQDRAAAQLLDDGIHHWNASRHCWAGR